MSATEKPHLVVFAPEETAAIERAWGVIERQDEHAACDLVSILKDAVGHMVNGVNRTSPTEAKASLTAAFLRGVRDPRLMAKNVLGEPYHAYMTCLGADLATDLSSADMASLKASKDAYNRA